MPEFNEFENKDPERPVNLRLGWIWIAILTLIVIALGIGRMSNIKETSWQAFERDMLRTGAVERLVVSNQSDVQVYLKKDRASDPKFKEAFQLGPLSGEKINPGPHYHFSIGSVESFDRRLDEVQKQLGFKQAIEVVYITNPNIWLTLLPWVLPLLLLMLLFRFYGSRNPGGVQGPPSVFNFGRSTARLQEEATSSVTFADVAGLEEAKFEVKEICDFLKEPSRYTRLGARIPKGIMIVGPPGTGKTLLAKAVAGEARVPFFSISGSEFVEMFVGVGASRVRDLFRRAKEKAPCIIFIDEIDAVGRSRGRPGMFTGANDERESTLNQLLTEMDGFGTNSGVIVLAATNRADVLDPALLRPGRFDRHIYLELPGLAERKQIFQVHVKKIKISNDVDIDFLAAQTPGFSGADIANICNEAALIAARETKTQIVRQDFMDAIDRVVAGLEKKSKIITAREKKIIAFHESGHALASWYLPLMDPLMKVSIIPRGKTLGAAWYLPAEKQIRTYSELSQRLSALLAGRAAEEIIFGEVSSGALDDLEKVTHEAYTMVAFYGFNKKIGNVSFYDSTGRQESSLQKPYSEETARLMDEEVRKMVEEAYSRSLTLIKEKRDQLVQLATRLLKVEILEHKELEEILGKRNMPELEKVLVETAAMMPHSAVPD
ncbi:MAG: ATP-dependent zinc metalloprotease FtsH [Cyclobacteriaceae bacterium]